MSDIVEMLRSIAEPIDGSDLWVIREAADEIERLRGVVDEARFILESLLWTPEQVDAFLAECIPKLREDS